MLMMRQTANGAPICFPYRAQFIDEAVPGRSRSVYVTPNLSVTNVAPSLSPPRPSLSRGAAPSGRPTPQRLRATWRHACSRSKSSWLVTHPTSLPWLHMIHVCAATSACWMTGTVQLLEPQPEACVKDSAIAARRAAVGQIGRTACLYVCPRLSLGARRCNNFRTLRCCECPREKMTGIFTQP